MIGRINIIRTEGLQYDGGLHIFVNRRKGCKELQVVVVRFRRIEVFFNSGHDVSSPDGHQ